MAKIINTLSFKARTAWFIVLVSIFGLLLFAGSPPTATANTIPPGREDYLALAMDETLPPASWQEESYARETASGDGYNTLTNGACSGSPSSWNYHMIVFTSFRDLNWEIYYRSSNTDLSAVNRITYHEATDIRPALKKGGTEVVFASNRTGDYELYKQNLDGTGLARLTNHPGYDSQADWSPDGTMVVFVSDRDGDLEMYTIKPDGTGIEQLTFNSVDDFSPTWSPSGVEIAWIQIVDDTHGQIKALNLGTDVTRNISTPYAYLDDLTYGVGDDKIGFTYDKDGDYWWDASLYSITTNKIIYTRGGGYLHETRMGDYLSTDSFVFSDFTWTYSDGQFYITEIKTFFDNIGIYSKYYLNTYFDDSPYAAYTDRSAPRTKVQSLPEFSRVNDTLIRWKSLAVGPAPTCTVDIYARRNDAAWYKFKSTTQPLSEILFTGGSPGDHLCLYSTGTDDAANTETYSGTPDTCTTLYLWSYQTTVSDTRGMPLPGISPDPQPAILSSVESQRDGTILQYLKDSSYSLAFHAAGYGPVPATTITMQEFSPDEGDFQRQWWILPPENDLIQNGGFEEDSLVGWQVISPTLTELAEPHSGEHALVIKGEETRLGETPVRGIQQVVSIPADMHAPTLSFVTLIPPFSETLDIPALELLINGTTIGSFFPNPLFTWEHAWFDLSVYKGQEITITFRVPGTYTQFLAIDEVSLGPWETPLVESVFPPELPSWEGKTITITGQNFISSPVVLLGDTPAVNVTYVNSTTITATIPAGMDMGMVAVHVENPGGQAAVAPTGLILGHRLTLPLIVNNYSLELQEYGQ